MAEDGKGGKKGKKLADLKMTPQGLEEVQPPPQERRQQISAKEIGEAVLVSLLERTSKDGKLNDKDFVRKYLRNRRRTCLTGIADAIIAHGTAVEDMAVTVLRYKNTEHAEKMKLQKTQEVQSCMRQIESWEMELKAVVAVSKSQDVEKKIDEFYGDTQLSTDNETTG